MAEDVLSEWEDLKLRQSLDGARISWLDCKSCGLQFRILASYDWEVGYVCPSCRSESVLAHIVKVKPKPWSEEWADEGGG